MNVIWKGFNWVVKYPKITLILLLVMTLLLGLEIRHFRLDASVDTLIQKNDPSLVLTRQIQRRFGHRDQLLIMFRPKSGSLFSARTIESLKHFQEHLSQLTFVKSVVTLLDAPIFDPDSPSLETALNSQQTLRNTQFSESQLKTIFSNNPLYHNFLISPDLRSTAILLTIDLQPDPTWVLGTDGYRQAVENNKAQLIADIRTLMAQYRPSYTMFLGGASMITHDLMRFIRRDIALFGSCALGLLILMLWVVFRQVRGIVFPIISCLISIMSTIGLLGLINWKVTVISSNFISVQLILNLALCLHLMIKYRQIHYDQQHHISSSELVLQTLKNKLRPCFYATLTTIAGFASLLTSNMMSVVTFGWIMIMGMLVSFLVTFLVFPSLMSLLGLPRVASSYKDSRYHVPLLMKKWVDRYPKKLQWSALVLLVLSGMGISRLEVENRFIDYFKSDTEIHQGLTYIDQHLGGTIPMHVVLTFDEETTDDQFMTSDQEFDEFDEFDDLDASQSSKYWFTPIKIDKILKVQHYLAQLPQTGKVLSFGTTLQLAEQLNHGPLDTFALTYLYERVPDKVKEMVVSPYLSIDHNQARFWVRVKDSDPSLRRHEFIEGIKAALPKLIDVKPSQFSYSGELILYNNVLQGLFQSQLSTLGFVLVVLLGMFCLSFRSIKLALIGMAPNLLAVLSVLGVMGWVGIPLDLMTITLASIALGIAVDDTIHYLEHVQKQFLLSGDYHQSIHHCHQSTGLILFYTTVVIAIGFSILGLSDFMPSVYFGVLTCLAMVIALLLTLALLPRLIMIFKPLGPDQIRQDPHS